MAEVKTQRIPIAVPTSKRAVKLDDGQSEAQRVVRGELNSKQVEDPFKKFYTDGADLSIASPPFELNAMLRMVQENAMLRQCIESMVTNVEGHGYRMTFIGEDGKEETDEAKAELDNLEGFFDAPNDSYSLIEMRTRCRWDLETLGNAYIEVARNQKGEVTALWHIPAHLVRITNTDATPVAVKAKLARRTGTIEQTINKYFRRFVQLAGTKKIYFKEFGDPRKINPANGKEDAALAHEDTATEIIHLKLYNPGSVYGLPRWIPQMPSIKGSRQAELTNLEYFTDNAVPAMVLLVSGGSVTETSLNALEDHMQGVRGRKAQNRIVTIEATGDEHAAAENGTIAPPRVELKSLQGDRQGDALFQQYESDCHAKVRSAFRLPPIFVGLSEDYNYATAKTAFEVAESQVFGPERSIIDDVINRKILATWQVKYWQFRSNPPRISDPEEVLKALEAFDKVGAMTPNVAIGMANELFDLDISNIEDEWGNWPFAMVKELGASGRIKGMDEFIKEVDLQLPKPGDDPDAGNDNKHTGTAPEQDDPTPFEGKKGKGNPKPDKETAQKQVQDNVRDMLLAIRNAVAHPADVESTDVVMEDGSSVKVRKRARN